VADPDLLHLVESLNQVNKDHLDLLRRKLSVVFLPKLDDLAKRGVDVLENHDQSLSLGVQLLATQDIRVHQLDDVPVIKGLQLAQNRELQDGLFEDLVFVLVEADQLQTIMLRRLCVQGVDDEAVLPIVILDLHIIDLSVVVLTEIERKVVMFDINLDRYGLLDAQGVVRFD